MCDGKERDETGGDFPYPWVSVERSVEAEVSGFVEAEPERGTGEKLRHAGSLGVNGRGRTAEYERANDEKPSRGTHVAAPRVEAQQLL